MKGNTWNNIVKPIVVLGAICLVASAALAAVNEVTAPIIKAQEEAAANEAYFAVLPEADGFEAVTDYQTSNIQAVMKATNGAGWAIQAYGKGFGGDVPVVVGFDAGGAIVGIQFMENSETAGYGQKLVDGSEDGIAFTQQFIGMTEAPVVGTNIDAISGATVSSKAAASAVTSAMNCFNEVALGQAAVIDEGPVTLSPEEVRAMLAPNATLTQIDAPEGLTEAWQGDDGSYVLYAEDKGWEYATSPMTIAVGFDAKPGCFASAVRLLADKGFDMEYMYAFISRDKGKAYVIIRLDNGQKAAEALHANGFEILSPEAIYKM